MPNQGVCLTTHPNQPAIRQRGFTLLEVMLVLVLMGLAVSYVVFNAFGRSQSEELDKEVRRFQVVFDMASDYAVLNQQQLGVRFDIKKGQYLFLYLDEEQNWQEISDDKVFLPHQLPDVFTFELALDDLPWEEDNLFDNQLFDEALSFDENRVSIGDEEDKPVAPPQVFIFASGEITPFSLAFSYEPDFGDDEPVYYRINGQDEAPLERLGPLDSL